MSHKFENITFNELPMAIAHLIAEVETLKAMVQTGVNCTEDADKWFNLEELRAYLPDKPAKQMGVATSDTISQKRQKITIFKV